MSTIPEVTVARHAEMKTLVIALVTNQCVMDVNSTKLTNHEEVLQTTAARMDELKEFCHRFLSILPSS